MRSGQEGCHSSLLIQAGQLFSHHTWVTGAVWLVAPSCCSVQLPSPYKDLHHGIKAPSKISFMYSSLLILTSEGTKPKGISPFQKSLSTPSLKQVFVFWRLSLYWQGLNLRFLPKLNYFDDCVPVAQWITSHQ